MTAYIVTIFVISAIGIFFMRRYWRRGMHKMQLQTAPAFTIISPHEVLETLLKEEWSPVTDWESKRYTPHGFSLQRGEMRLDLVPKEGTQSILYLNAPQRLSLVVVFEQGVATQAQTFMGPESNKEYLITLAEQKTLQLIHQLVSKRPNNLEIQMAQKDVRTTSP